MAERRLHNRIVWLALIALGVSGLLGLGYGLLVSGKASGLERCTRVEIGCGPSALEYICPRQSSRTLLFTPSELEYLTSLDMIPVDDPKAVRALAQAIGSELDFVGGPSTPGKGGGVSQRLYLRIDWYRHSQRLAATIWHWRPKSVDPVSFISATRPYQLRVMCATNIGVLRWQDALGNPVQEYPRAANWCDELLAGRRTTAMPGIDTLPSINTLVHLRCPSAGEGRCHYAMNPDCEPNSPKDTVLLFETKAGWNQHGGPELFTFDNHDPKGGCVQFNDGTVKFIRTKEELAQLRWKP